jgi:hypothetical protein
MTRGCRPSAGADLSIAFVVGATHEAILRASFARSGDIEPETPRRR